VPGSGKERLFRSKTGNRFKRAHAEQFDGPEVKRMMLEIAESYDKLAKHAAERRSIERARG
jgi:hypothetical protein